MSLAGIFIVALVTVRIVIPAKDEGTDDQVPGTRKLAGDFPIGRTGANSESPVPVLGVRGCL